MLFWRRLRVCERATQVAHDEAVAAVGALSSGTKKGSAAEREEMKEAYHHPRRNSMAALKDRPERETTRRRPMSKKEGKQVQKPAQTAPVVDELFEAALLPQPQTGGGLDAGPAAQALPRPTQQVQKAAKKALLLTARRPSADGRHVCRV